MTPLKSFFLPVHLCPTNQPRYPHHWQNFHHFLRHSWDPWRASGSQMRNTALNWRYSQRENSTNWDGSMLARGQELIPGITWFPKHYQVWLPNQITIIAITIIEDVVIVSINYSEILKNELSDSLYSWCNIYVIYTDTYVKFNEIINQEQLKSMKVFLPSFIHCWKATKRSRGREAFW